MDHDDTEEDFSSAPALDRITAAIAYCDRAAELYDLAVNNKTYKARLRKQARLEKDIAAAEQKLMALTAEAEQKETALAAREAALDVRETEFQSSCEEAHANLRASYDSIAEADRHIRYRILSFADLLSGYNPQLQDLPGWPQIKQMVVGLPDDPPPIEREVVSRPRIDAVSDVFNDPGADRHGTPFLSTLSRSISHKAAGQ